MRESTVTDKGLARRLGQNVFVGKEGKRGHEVRGKLVYYPKGYAVLLPDKKVVPIKPGSIVGLRRGSGLANWDPHFLEYEYIGNI